MPFHTTLPALTMRVLLIESVAEDVLFLRDVLTEIGEGGFWSTWVNMEILQANSWSDAAALLSEESVDLILLDLDVLDSQGIETFRRAQRAAQDIPMVLLVGRCEEGLGVRLVRDGAQDFLVKKQIDCAPLAHAMQNAIERHRVLTAARVASTHDPLTGLANRAGFLATAHRDSMLAEKLGRRLMIMVAEPENLGEITSVYGEQRQDLALVEAADHLRNLAGPVHFLGRIEETRFALSIFDTLAEPVEAARQRIEESTQPLRIRTGSAIYVANHPIGVDALLEEAIGNLSRSSVATHA